MAAAGDYVLVCYDVPGPALWHERLITGVDRTRAGVYSVMTPDGDHYVEELHMQSEDIVGLRSLDRPGDTPAGIEHSMIYRFREVPSGAALRQIMRDGSLMVGAALPSAPTVLRPPGGVLPRQGRALATEPLGHVWVVVEDVAGMLRGEIVDELDEGAVVLSGRALMTLEGGEVAILRSMPRTAVAEYIRDDLRILPVRFDAAGRRHRAFGEAVELLSADEPAGGLMLEGPSTVHWLAQHRRDAGGSFTTGHEHWLRAAAIPNGDRSAYEHEVLARVLDSMLCTDQLNLPALQSAELVARRMQLIEEAHRLSPSAPDYSAADHFMGWSSRTLGTAVAPRLRDHVATNLRGDAAVAKEARKAAEEARLRRQRTAGRGKKGQGSAEGPDPGQ